MVAQSHVGGLGKTDGIAGAIATTAQRESSPRLREGGRGKGGCWFEKMQVSCLGRPQPSSLKARGYAWPGSCVFVPSPFTADGRAQRWQHQAIRAKTALQRSYAACISRIVAKARVNKGKKGKGAGASSMCALRPEAVAGFSCLFVSAQRLRFRPLFWQIRRAGL